MFYADAGCSFNVRNQERFFDELRQHVKQTEKKPLQIGVSSKNNNIPVWKIIRKQILERTGLAEDM